jgi:hypothetical protein
MSYQAEFMDSDCLLAYALDYATCRNAYKVDFTFDETRQWNLAH